MQFLASRIESPQKFRTPLPELFFGGISIEPWVAGRVIPEVTGPNPVTVGMGSYPHTLQGLHNTLASSTEQQQKRGSIVIDGVVVQWRQSWARLSPGFWNCLQEDAKRTLSWALSPQAQCA